MKMWPTMHSDAHLAHSSVGQSSGLIIRRSWDHAPLGPQKKRLRTVVTSFSAFQAGLPVPGGPEPRSAAK